MYTGIAHVIPRVSLATLHNLSIINGLHNGYRVPLRAPTRGEFGDSLSL